MRSLNLRKETKFLTYCHSNRSNDKFRYLRANLSIPFYQNLVHTGPFQNRDVCHSSTTNYRENNETHSTTTTNYEENNETHSTTSSLPSKTENSQIPSNINLPIDPIQLSYLNNEKLPSICSSIGQSTIIGHIKLRLALTVRLNACVDSIRLDTLLLCLKTLVRTEQQKENLISEKILRKSKGVVWSRSIDLRGIMKYFQEMAPKLTDRNLVDLFECSVELGISTTVLLNVIIQQLERRFITQTQPPSSQSQQGYRKNEKSYDISIRSPESLGLILRSVELCQDARLNATKHVALSHPKLISVHRDLSFILIRSISSLFRWGAHDWAWRAVVALDDEAAWRSEPSFTEAQLRMLKSRFRSDDFVNGAGTLTARINEILDEENYEAVGFAWSNIISQADTDLESNDFIFTGLRYVLDCCPNTKKVGKQELKKEPLKVNTRSQSSKKTMMGDERKPQNQDATDDEGDENLLYFVSTYEKGFSTESKKLGLTPSLFTLLTTLNKQLPLLSDLTLYQLFQMLINLKPFIKKTSCLTITTGPPAPYRVPKAFTTLLSGLFIQELMKRLRSAEHMAIPQRISSDIILCSIFKLLPEIPSPKGYTFKNPTWQRKLISESIPKLLRISSTTEEAIWVLRGTSGLEQSEERDEMLIKSLLEVLRRYRSVSILDSGFIDLANSLRYLKSMKREVIAICAILNYHLETNTLNPLLFFSFLEILPTSLCPSSVCEKAVMKLLIRVLQLLTIFISQEPSDEICRILNVSVPNDEFVVDVSTLSFEYIFNGITIAAILIQELLPTADNELQSVAGYLSLLDAKINASDPSTLLQFKKFRLNLLTAKVVEYLPIPSQLIQLLHETRVKEKNRLVKGRPVGFTRAHREMSRKSVDNKAKENRKPEKIRKGSNSEKILDVG